MLRVLLMGLTLLHLGPGLAFAVLAAGCGPSPWLRAAVCAADPVGGFMRLTVGAWAVLTLAWLAWAAVRRARTTRGLRTRLQALLAVLAAGAAAGAAGAWLTGAALSWLAVPAALAAAWLAVADPRACEAPPRSRGG
ncbi:MAG: hypothetical protein RMK34_05710 [Tepidimonas sp.]|uniref:hypothetical protein n=1 Tax=Tepidimonas sp. TaxID=2002775 RepID=UPI00298EF1E4|nr:hypothetical protein [Tepidimonas sp.]MCS6810170.1 hypothetical protein [Tepidimonas sp.]MDW8336451.1 hypothetical protein [Tepidimonas sp.]